MKREPFNLLVSMVKDYLRQTIKIPEIQRESKIWTLEQKQNLIDSLFNDFDIPKLYLRKGPSGKTIWWLIDGQQRLTTIAEFLNGDFSIGDSTTMPEKLHGKKYSKLQPEDKEKIIGRKLDCVIVECDDEEEEDMFLRLNNGTPLSSAEKRNAIRGKVRDSITNLAKHKFFKKKVAFSSKRFAHDAVTAQLVLLCLAGEPTDTKGKSLMNLYEQKKSSYPEQREVENKLKKILGRMDRIFLMKEPYMKKYNVISIFSFLFELIERYSIPNITDNQFRQFFMDFETSRISNSQKSEDDEGYDIDLGKYQTACINSPDSEDGIRVRHEILLKKFFSNYVDIEPKDKIRNFTEDQKRAIYYLGAKQCKGVSGFNCPNKSRLLAFEDCEFDHIKEYDDGGKTTVSNGQLLCSDCHSYKTHAYIAQKSRVRKS